MRTIIVAVIVCFLLLLFALSTRASFDPVRQADLADEIVGYRMFHSHLAMEWKLTEQWSEIIGKEIYRICTIMNLPCAFMCEIGVRNRSRILSQ